MENTLGEFLTVGVAVGDASPKEHSHLIGVILASEGIHYLLGIFASAGVCLDVGLMMPLLGVGECSSCRQLYSAECATVDIALNLENPLDEGGVGGAHSHAPSGHVMTLGHRVKLNAAVLCALHLKQ